MIAAFVARPLWQQALSLWALGALSAAAFPPLHLVPVLWLCFPIASIAVIRAASARDAAILGWAFFFGQFAAGLYWIGFSFQVDAATYGAIAIPAVGGLTTALGLFGAIWGYGVWKLVGPKTRAPIWVGALVVAAAFTLMEILRASILTGFPWNLMATVWTAWPVLIQNTAWWGAYGLSFITVWAAAAPLVLMEPHQLGRRARTITASAPLTLLLVLGLLGFAARSTPDFTSTQLRVVQPNIAQKDKWAPGLRNGHFTNLLELSTQAGPAPDVIVWPETAVPFALLEVRSVEQAIQNIAPENGAVVTGFVRREGRPGQSDYRVFNSLAVISREDGVRGVFDKVHLVPFGEYMPFRDLIPVDQLTGGGTDFSPGAGFSVLEIPGAPHASPLICYEIIFPAAVMPDGTPRPAWILNITNDAWFGVSSGPYQHLASAQLRAVEEGVPVIRSANTGVSAIIDPQGYVLERIGLETRGVIDMRLPEARAPTVFSRTGIWPVTLALIFGCLAVIFRFVRIGDD